MDERFGLPTDHRRYTALTGILVPSGTHREFRRRYYELLPVATHNQTGVTRGIPIVHASKLFPDQSDQIKLTWLSEIVQVCKDLDFSLLRVGYYESRQLKALHHSNEALLELCLMGLIFSLAPELDKHEIWPVMEASNPHQQDAYFAGFVQKLDYMTELYPQCRMSINNSNLGEMHYVTKRSIYGSTVDCLSYLMDARLLVASGAAASEFKQKLARAAENLDSITTINEVIEMKFGAPPPDYSSNGPARYMVKVTPSD